jgi:hypothetical protein
MESLKSSGPKRLAGGYIVDSGRYLDSACFKTASRMTVEEVV